MIAEITVYAAGMIVGSSLTVAVADSTERFYPSILTKYNLIQSRHRLLHQEKYGTSF